MKRYQDPVPQLAKIGAEAEEEFGGLTATQLDWKPSPKQWSVAQCLDHLIVSQSEYFPLFSALTAGTLETPLWARISPLSGFFGRFMIRSLQPELDKKFRAPKATRPASSAIGEGIVKRFVEHQDELVGYVERLPDDLDRARTIVASPFLPLVTYSLEDCLTILWVHGRRHLEQARRVTRAEGFPAATED